VLDNALGNAIVKRKNFFRLICQFAYRRNTRKENYSSGQEPLGFFPRYCITGNLCRSNSVCDNVGCKSSGPNKCNRSCLRTSGTPNSCILFCDELPITMRCSVASLGSLYKNAPVLYSSW